VGGETCESCSVGTVFTGYVAKLVEFGTGTLKVVATGSLTCVHDGTEFGVYFRKVVGRRFKGVAELEDATGFR
jgi:hypothetical protein